MNEESDDTIHGCGRVFDDGVARGVYTDACGLILVTFHSSEDKGYVTILKSSPGLSAVGDSPEESVSEFCAMLPAAISAGLRVADLSLRVAY